MVEGRMVGRGLLNDNSRTLYTHSCEQLLSNGRPQQSFTGFPCHGMYQYT